MSVQSLEMFRRFSLNGKSYFLFPDVLKRWSFQKKLHWNMIFLLLSRKIKFLFPENMMLYLRRKMKDDLSQKNTRKYDIFFKLSEKMVFPKRAGPAHDPSCIIWKDGIFFPENMMFFLVGRNERRSFSGNTWTYDIFCVDVRVLQTWCHAPLSKKIKDCLIPQKYT